ncbi:MAG TPA: Hsp20/alpha crystallin family protein [Gaiellaceae bacterium]|nr:Hsp20/alpha crystallin family protein [Gaiellaceae bacterium]
MPRKRDLRDEIDELFADLWQVSRLGGLRRGFRPQLDCFRTEDPATFTVIVDISGVDPERVHVTTADGSLVIAGDRRRDDCEGRSYQQMEIEYGAFQRVVQLPDDADPAHAEATYDRGLLSIVIPIAQPASRTQPVPIQVRRST